jgi:biopolymer transport protein ExbD
MARKRERKPLQTMANPDVTPLVDLTFLLLIVFMITAPALENALKIDAPELDGQAADLERKHHVVNIDQTGKYYLDDDEMNLEELETTLSRVKMDDPQIEIYLRADERRQYGEVMAVMRAIRRAGIDNPSLVTVPEE